MKTLVVKGVFEKLSGGRTNTHWYFHDFCEIGGQRILRVQWTSFMESFVRDALGKTVEIGFAVIGGVHRIVCLKFDGKTEVDPNKYVVQPDQGVVLWTYLASVVGFFFLALLVLFITNGGLIVFMSTWVGGALLFTVLRPAAQMKSRYDQATKLLG